MTIKERAIGIAMRTFLSDFEGTEVEVYEKLLEENRYDGWDVVDYATVWAPFEDEPIGYAISAAKLLVEEITEALNECIGEWHYGD